MPTKNPHQRTQPTVLSIKNKVIIIHNPGTRGQSDIVPESL